MRAIAAEALGEIGDPVAIQPLTEALKDNNQLVRSNAASALGKTDHADAVQPLVKALKDEQYHVIMNAAEALGKIGDPGAVQPLISSLKNENFYVRGNAASALGEICDSVAVPLLICVIQEDKDEYVRKCAAEALDNLINSNKPYRELHPHLVCRKCLFKTQINEIEAGRFKKYVYAACRGCGTWSHLIQNVRKSVGIVGGDTEDYYTDEDSIYINLWSEQQKKARNADIDVLEIREGKNINYDYAINAVLITLSEMMCPDQKNIPVIIHKKASVPEGVMVILSHEFGEIIIR